MKIYYDNMIYSLQKAGGISIYWYEIMKRLIRDKIDVSFVENVNADNIFRNRIVLEEKIVCDLTLPINIIRYFPVLKNIKGGSIFHSSYYRISPKRGVVNITTVHDFTYEYFSKGIKKWINYYQKKIAIYFSKGIICISENTKKDLLKFHPWAKNKRIKVIYNGVSDEFEFMEKEKLKEVYEKYGREKYILFVGDRAKYKNFDIAVEALVKLSNYKLLIIGGKPLSKVEVDFLDKKLFGRYKRLEGISTNELNKIYNISFCLVYPSEYEGFGIPPLEAMKAGCPVIVNNSSSLPEVVGDAAIILDNIDSLKIVNGIQNLENDIFRNELIKKGLIQVKKFDWEKTYNETLSFYEEIYNQELGDNNENINNNSKLQ